MRRRAALAPVVAPVVALALAACQAAACGPPTSYPADLVPSHANVAYAPLSRAQVLDLFLPAGSGPFPLVVNIHGGAFRFGSKEMLDAPVARALLAAGIAVASVDYRLSGEAPFPAAVQDVKAAVRYLRANALSLRLDGLRIIAFGQSAGGNLASMLGATGVLRDFDDPALGHAEESSAVLGVVDWFGPTDFLQMDAQAKAQGCGASDQQHGAEDSPESRYLGAAIAGVPELVARANPITHLTAAAPPYLLQKGAKDCTVPVGQSRLLADALRRAGVPVTFDLLEQGGHGDMGGPPVFLSAGNVARVVTWITDRFAQAQAPAPPAP